MGTRFLPATKALAKEMLPIVDKTYDPIYRRRGSAGIEETCRNRKAKRSIEDHLDSDFSNWNTISSKSKGIWTYSLSMITAIIFISSAKVTLEV